MARKSTSRRGPRASWKGPLKLNLVSLPVMAFNAISGEGTQIHLHQLHAECHSRIEHHKVCPIHGEVGNNEIVLGYEYGRDKYVEVDPEELDKLRTKSERALRIDTFVDPEELDPMYFDGRSYYLAPDGSEARKSYAVMCAALERSGRYGIGEMVFSEREQLVALRPRQGVLVVSMLHHAAEFRQPHDVVPEKLKAPTKEIALAQTLIKAATVAFDYRDYVDRYRERLEQLIDAKVKGKDIVTPAEEEEPEVINLMDALRKSVAQAGGHGHRDGRRSPAHSTAKRKKSRSQARKTRRQRAS